MKLSWILRQLQGRQEPRRVKVNPFWGHKSILTIGTTYALSPWQGIEKNKKNDRPADLGEICQSLGPGRGETGGTQERLQRQGQVRQLQRPVGAQGRGRGQGAEGRQQGPAGAGQLQPERAVPQQRGPTVRDLQGGRATVRRSAIRLARLGPSEGWPDSGWTEIFSPQSG